MLLSKGKSKIHSPKSRIKRLKWGVAGCGVFLEHNFLPSLQLFKRNRLISVYSSDINRAKYIGQKFTAESCYDNFDEFLKTDIEAVYISSNNADHYWQVIKAAKAGKHILCEKPMAVNSQQAEEMVSTCKENNVQFAVDYIYRFHPLIQKANELIEKGMIGKIISVSANFNVELAPTNNYRFKKELGGGVLRDLGTHLIDLLRYFGGEITEITGYVDNVIYKSEVDDFAAGITKFEKGGYGQFNVTFNTKKAFNRVEILGYNGAISIENFIGKKNVSAKLTIDLKDEKKKSFRKRANKMNHMIRSIQKSFMNNRIPIVTGTDGLVNLKLIEQLESKCT
ncbi:MAG: Gfo/Idh/MocA family oxidoreductase [Melioribacteraceae bacterium]|nr:Gfo/Idh/MocA family oxidoreductase [Melioribacteraceae bacterium]MCF8356442.1 Gfo/Idh/MocA family oxidoreductase [Melioribacteraceae bacterium]MCF8394865.1 Gfo/Idh/MocA family oxidoreductase [Melioribacteraceae bacterium]MCF8420593.1 Gfo/Idh/MocA family oxidoreductase [Melioribacteraceae bacterium]